MAEFLLGAAAFILAMVALGLVRVLRGPADADRMMAAQLLGTGGIGWSAQRDWLRGFNGSAALEINGGEAEVRQSVAFLRELLA